MLPFQPNPASAVANSEPWNGAEAFLDLSFPESDRIAAVAFPHGTDTIYVQLNPTVLNLWDAALYYWPELVPILLAPFLLACLFFIARIARRREQIGAWLCRCGYNLSGSHDPRSTTCPECGVNTAKHRPHLGKARWRRALPAMLVAVALPLAYAALHLAEVPRTGRLTARYVISWQRFTDEAESRQWTELLKFKQPIDRVIELDIRTGASLRTLYEVGKVTDMPMRLSDDGLDLISLAADGSLTCRDAKSGRVRSRLHLPERCQGSLSYWSDVAGFGAEGIVYVVLVDETDDASHLVAWSTRNGSCQDVIVAPEIYHWSDSHRGGGVVGARFSLIPGNEPRFLSVREILGSSEVSCIAYTSDGAIAWKANFIVDSERCLAISPHLQSVLFPSGESIGAVDLSTGAVQPTSVLDPYGRMGYEAVIASNDGRLLFVSASDPGEIAIYDTVDRSWLQPLFSTVFTSAIFRSHDDRWLAATGMPISDVEHLLLFDISRYPRMADGKGEPDASSPKPHILPPNPPPDYLTKDPFAIPEQPP